MVQPSSFADCIDLLKQKANITIPTNDDEWSEIPRMCIDVRRDRVLADTLREMSKPRFDYTKLLKVYVPEYIGVDVFQHVWYNLIS